MAAVMWNRENIEKIKHKLIEWDDLKNPRAPLSEKQLYAIEQLGEVIKNRPLPPNVNNFNNTLLLIFLVVRSLCP